MVQRLFEHYRGGYMERELAGGLEARTSQSDVFPFILNILYFPPVDYGVAE